MIVRRIFGHMIELEEWSDSLHVGQWVELWDEGGGRPRAGQQLEIKSVAPSNRLISFECNVSAAIPSARSGDRVAFGPKERRPQEVLNREILDRIAALETFSYPRVYRQDPE